MAWCATRQEPSLTIPQIYRTATGGHGCLWSGLRSKRPIDRGSRRRQEDYEALQHPRPVQANVSRIETLEAPAS